MANPGVLTLNAYQGDRLEVFFRVRALVWNDVTEQYDPGPFVDLTGQVPTAHIKEAKADLTPIATFQCTLADQVTIPGGVLLVLLPADATLLTKTSYFYDVQLKADDTHVTTYLQGQILVTAQVTV